MGIDYGSARVGISITDPLKIIASDFEVIKNSIWDKLKADYNDRY